MFAVPFLSYANRIGTTQGQGVGGSLGRLLALDLPRSANVIGV
ncbi:hypothetical protein BH23CHL9_BH23CHL9_06000 [soil metagenome]|jgi:hypothetical protein